MEEKHVMKRHLSMRKVFTMILALALTLSCGITAFATDVAPGNLQTNTEAKITITDNNFSTLSDTFSLSENTAAPVYEMPAGQQAIYVEKSVENGMPIVKKEYEISSLIDPQTLALPFEEDGFRFTVRDIQHRELPGETLARPARKSISVESDTDDEMEIFSRFPTTIIHEEDGYSGQLHLDLSTLTTEAGSYETYTTPYTRTREIPGLSRNDPSLVEKTWNGMRLSGVTFKQGADGRYTATAAYQGMTTERRATGYVITATYYGEVAKTMPGNILNTVIYEGVPIESADSVAESPVNAEAKPPAADADKEKGNIYLLPIIISGIVFVVAVVLALLFIKRKLRKEKNQGHETIKETKRFFKED
jgi:hypothetical protein